MMEEVNISNFKLERAGNRIWWWWRWRGGGLMMLMMIDCEDDINDDEEDFNYDDNDNVDVYIELVMRLQRIRRITMWRRAVKKYW